MPLTESQERAAQHAGPAVFVIAGPGSGKTHTMVSSIAGRVGRGVDPSRIMVVTFTRLAARQMRERLHKAGVRGVTIGTFHSICYQIVRTRWRELGFASEAIQVIDQVAQEAVIKEAIAMSSKKPSKAAVMRELDRLSRGEADGERDAAVASVVSSYMRTLRLSNAMDYFTVPYTAIKTASETPLPYTHIYVDEAQDLDRAQWSLFRCSKVEMLFAVGDPDQLLYSWRGADPRLLQEQIDVWDADTVVLEENFRSGRLIGEAADKVIAQNKMRVDKKIVPALDFDGGVEFVSEDGVAEAVQKSVSEGHSVAVIGRTHMALSGVNGALMNAGIHTRLVSAGQKLMQREDIRTLLAMVGLPDMPNAELASRAVWAKHGMNKIDIERGIARCKRARETFLSFTLERLPGLARVYEDTKDSGLIEKVMACAEYMRGLTGSISKEDESGFIRLVSRFVRQHPWKERTGDRLVAWMNIQDESEEAMADDGIPVMTIHASKGLEFDCVVLCGLDDRTMPIKSAHNDEERMEEERRLMFVAMTRARSRLVLVTPAENPSRFLADIQ
jgi:DNA helicase-2/ATP-dependent DNA helicase PcrA